MSRLTIDITEKQHQSLKALAALQGKTIKQYTLERLFPAQHVAEEDWMKLKTLLDERIAEGLAGQLSSTVIEAIVDEELAEDISN